MNESESLWYPAFNLTENPFSLNDYGIEREFYVEVPLVQTKSVKKVINLVKCKSTVKLVGIKGGGKSVSIALSAKEVEKAVAMIAPRNLADVYNYLFDYLVGFEAGNEERGIEEKLLWKDALTIVQGTGKHSSFDQGWLLNKKRCSYWDCRKKERCQFIATPRETLIGLTDEKILPTILEELFHITRNCPMKRFFVHILLDECKRKLKGYVFLLDVPDDLVEHKFNRRTFETLVGKLQRAGPVIITATRKQAGVMLNGEALSRIPTEEFPLPTEEELKTIYIERLKSVQEGNFKPIFTDKALKYLITFSNRVPREFISKCREVLNAMYEKELTEPASFDFAVSAFGLATTLSELDVIQSVIAELKIEMRVWVKVKEILERVEARGITITDYRLGRLLKNTLKLPQRNNPDSEYKVRA